MSSKFKMERDVKTWYDEQFYEWFIRSLKLEEYESDEVRSLRGAKSFIQYLTDKINNYQGGSNSILDQHGLVNAIITRTSIAKDKIMFMTKFYHDLLNIPMKHLNELQNWSSSLAYLIDLTQFDGEASSYAYIWLNEITINDSVEFIRNTRNVKKVIVPINFEDDLSMVYDISIYITRM